MPRSATSRLHRRSSCRHYPRGRLRYADRLRRPRWRYRQLSTNIPPGPLNAGRSLAGPPFISDDPEPTDYKHYEIYAFNRGTATRDGTSGASGIDFNYGAAPNLQLTAVVPAGFDRPSGGATSIGLSNIELAAKYRFLRQDSFGLDVSIFPRVFLPSGSSAVGDTPIQKY
jgi:hypothetical protein